MLHPRASFGCQKGDIVAVALEVGELFPVFPCKSDKSPNTRNGYKDATQDPESIEKMFSRPGSALIGVPTGRESRLLVIDIDRKNGKDGLTWLDGKSLPPTRVHSTMNGGLHYLFNYPTVSEVASTYSTIAEGVDVLGATGYIIWPDGKCYKCEVDDEIAKAPAWLLRELNIRAERKRSDPSARPVNLVARGALSDAIELIQSADAGARHDPLLKATAKLAASGVLPGDALSLITAIGGYASSDPADLYRMLTSGYEKYGPSKPADQILPFLSCEDFLSEYKPAEYIVEGMFQKGYVYSITAKPGAGKTTVLLNLAMSAAGGRNFAGRATKKCRVLFMAGENPDDVRIRIQFAAEQIGLAADDIDMIICPGAFRLSAYLDNIVDRIEENSGFDLIVIDTAAAFFQGDDENSNTEIGQFARDCRSLTGALGNPAVVIATHPKKNASSDNLEPRGGSAFLGEVDGNLSLSNHGNARVVMKVCGKFRGTNFEPLEFELKFGECDAFADWKGNPIRSVMAKWTGQLGHGYERRTNDVDDDLVLNEIFQDPAKTQRKICEKLGWVRPNGNQMTSRISNSIERLKEHGYIETAENGKFRVSALGEGHLKNRR